MELKYKFDPSIYNVVAKNVKKYREKSAISIKTLSECTGISEDFLKNFEQSNNIAISINDIYKISVVLDISIDKLFES